MTTALFAGSFDPFTAGHADIVSRGLALFDRIVICIGVNADKSGASPFGNADTRRADIERFYSDNPRVDVIVSTDLITRTAGQLGATALIRSARSVKDYEYERDMATINRQISGIDTVILTARPELESISSSVVRELYSYGMDIGAYLPNRFVISAVNIEGSHNTGHRDKNTLNLKK